jgi:hypothetical protein
LPLVGTLVVVVDVVGAEPGARVPDVVVVVS